MGKLTTEQKEHIRQFLHLQGLSLKPLHDEMVDHMTCDLEERMAAGSSFDEAWHQSVNDIPNNHFQHIQKEVMETINKRFTWSQGFSFGALALMFIATLFKELHLQFGGQLLISGFVCLAISLITASRSGIQLKKEKKASMRLLTLITGTIILLAAFSFKFLHLTGADQLVVLGVTVLTLALAMNSLHSYQHSSGEGNLLTYLHEKYTPGIERFLLLLFLPVAIYKVISVLTGGREFVGNILLLVFVFTAGIQFFALNWRAMEKDLSKRNIAALISIIVCMLCFILPFLGPILPLEVRIILIALFSPIAGWLALRTDDESSRPISIVLAVLVSALFVGMALIHLSIIPQSSAEIFFNIPILLVLVAGIFVSRKQSTMRTFMLISAGGYLFEYIVL